MPLYTPDYLASQGFGAVPNPAEKLLAQSMGLTELPKPTPQLIQATSPMVVGKCGPRHAFITLER